MSDAFDERLERTRGDAARRAAVRQQAQAERERSSQQARDDAAAAARVLLPELLAAFDALREFEDADPARTSEFKIYRSNLNLGFFPDSAPVTFSREYRPARGLGNGSHLYGMDVHRGTRRAVHHRSPDRRRAAHRPSLSHARAAADAGIYSSSGRVVVTSEAFEAVIQMIVDHIARGHRRPARTARLNRRTSSRSRTTPAARA